MKKLKLGQVNYISVIKTAQMESESTYDVNITRSDNSEIINLEDTLLYYRDNAEFLTLSIDLTSLDSTEDNTTCSLDVYVGSIKVASYHAEMVSSQVRQRLSSSSDSIYYNVTRLVAGTQGDAPSEPDEPQEDSGSGNTDTMSVALRDNNYGDMSSPYYVRTDDWTIRANMSSIGSSIEKIKFKITDSSDQVISKVVNVSNRTLQVVSFDIEDETINFGDVADWVIEGLNSSDEVIYTSSTYDLIIPPKLEIYIAQSLADANDMRTNGKTAIIDLNGSGNTYNVYMYVEDNHASTIILDNRFVNSDLVINISNAQRTDGFTPSSVTAPVGQMTEVDTNILSAWTYRTMRRSGKYYARFTWSGGFSTPLINNIEDTYNFNVYGHDSQLFTQRPYDRETLDIDGTFTLEGFSPMVHHSSSYSGTTLHIQVGTGSYQIDLTNRLRIVKVQQVYTDSSVVEDTLTQSDLGLVLNASQGSSFDSKFSVPILDNTKTIDYTKVWINYGTNGNNARWFNIDNSSSDAPHYKLEL